MSPETLRDWRKAYGWSLEEVADRIGRHFTTVARWERGIRIPQETELARLAEAYGVHRLALDYSPLDHTEAQNIGRALAVILRISREDAEAWLHVGERMIRETPQ